MFVISRASINYTEENLTKLELYLQHKTLLLTPKTQTLLLSTTQARVLKKSSGENSSAKYTTPLPSGFLAGYVCFRC
jgi:predicted component of type VI protein secretion system